MDRNVNLRVVDGSRSSVALRKESVDRNRQLLQESFLSYVALRKESVDRNKRNRKLILIISQSLSARRAWIEIIDYIIDYATDASLSARRAWIEIQAEHQ